jgi:hypothetical protein
VSIAFSEQPLDCEQMASAVVCIGCEAACELQTFQDFIWWPGQPFHIQMGFLDLQILQ